MALSRFFWRSVSLQMVIRVMKSLKFFSGRYPSHPKLKSAWWAILRYQRPVLAPALSSLPGVALAWMWEAKAVSISWAVR